MKFDICRFYSFYIRYDFSHDMLDSIRKIKVTFYSTINSLAKEEWRTNMKGNFHRSSIMITMVTGHTVSMIAIRFFDMENRRKRKSGKEGIAKRDQRLNPVLSGRSLIWLIISSRWSAIYHRDEFFRCAPHRAGSIPNFIEKTGHYCSQICVLPFLWKSSSLCSPSSFFSFTLSLFLFSFPFNVQGFQRFVESKFKPRFGNANSIEIFANGI